MEFIKILLTSLLSVVSLFIMAKIMGHKQMAELDFFDYISGITIGSIAAELAIDSEMFWKPLLAIIIYGVVSIGLSWITLRFPQSRKFINGTPTIIMDNGKLYRKNMKKAKLELSEFMVMLRQEGYFNLNDINTAVFEHNGHLTILPKSSKRPITPEDMNISVKQEEINTEIIMDGQIMHENLKRLGFNIEWLEKQLKDQRFKSAKEIYLGICDKDNNVTFFPFN